MSDGLTREIVEQIIQQRIIENWYFYAMLAAVSLISTMVSAFLLSYVRKRGETFATKADMSELAKQIKATTTVVEETKTAISHADWSAREWKVLRTAKLEELLIAVYRVGDWLKKDRDSMLFDGPMNDAETPIHQIEVLARLYFPELHNEFHALGATYQEYRNWIESVRAKLAARDPAR